MFKQIIIISFLFFCSFTVYCQSIIDGSVIDQSTGVPISYANILVEHTNYGTASNAEGEFSLKVNTLPVHLKISYIGYETKTVDINEVNEWGITIKLKPSVISLQEVTVTNDFEINLVEKAIQRIISAKDKEVQGKAFYRQLTQSDSIYTEFIETFYRANLNINGIKSWKVEQGRYAFIPVDSLRYGIHFTNFSKYSLTNMVQTKPYSKNTIWPLREDTRKYYVFYLNKEYKQDGNIVYVIEFEPKKDIKKPAFTGYIAIVDNSYVIQELEMKISDPRYNPLNTYSKQTTSENVALTLHYRNSSLEANGRHYYPKILNMDLTFDYIQKKGLFGTVDFSRRVHTRSLLYFFDYETDGISQFFTDDYFSGIKSEVSDYKRIDETDYNPQFWENNPIIKRTPVEQKVIESFEEYGSFGKMLDSQESEASESQ